MTIGYSLQIMMTRLLYATGTSTAIGAAQLVIQGALRLRGIHWASMFDSITDGASAVMEISTVNAAQATVNDARGLIAVVRWYGNFVTSGLSQGGLNFFIPTNHQFRAADIVYLHMTVSGTVTFHVSPLLLFF